MRAFVIFGYEVKNQQEKLSNLKRKQIMSNKINDNEQ